MEEEARRSGWRVSVVEKDGQEPQRVVRRISEGWSLETVLERLRDTDLAWLLTQPNWAAWWRLAAGEEVARQTRVTSFRNGFLYVAVDSAPLRMELQNFHRGELVRRLRQFGADAVTVRDIKFHSGGKTGKKKKE